MILSDKLLALVFAGLAALFFALTLDFPSFPGQRFGPALFPRLLAAAMLVSAAILFLRAPRTPEAGGLAVRSDPALRESHRLIGFLAIPGAVIFYLLAAERLGFVPTAFLMLLGLMLWFRVGALRALVVAALATGLVHYFFAGLMRVPLPRGLFMQLVAGG